MITFFEEDVMGKKIIIEGITQEGQTFRPSDWAERMSGKLSTLKKRRLHYSPMLQPSTRDGHRCVIVDPQLQTSHPDLYASIMKFVEHNKLKICQDSTPSDDSEAPS